jgi:hypothetical protein
MRDQYNVEWVQIQYSPSLTSHLRKLKLSFHVKSLVATLKRILRLRRTFGIVASLDEALDEGTRRGLDFPVNDHRLFTLDGEDDRADLDAGFEFTLKRKALAR